MRPFTTAELQAGGALTYNAAGKVVMDGSGVAAIRVAITAGNAVTAYSPALGSLRKTWRVAESPFVGIVDCTQDAIEQKRFAELYVNVAELRPGVRTALGQFDGGSPFEKLQTFANTRINSGRVTPAVALEAIAHPPEMWETISRCVAAQPAVQTIADGAVMYACPTTKINDTKYVFFTMCAIASGESIESIPDPRIVPPSALVPLATDFDVVGLVITNIDTIKETLATTTTVGATTVSADATPVADATPTVSATVGVEDATPPVSATVDVGVTATVGTQQSAGGRAVPSEAPLPNRMPS